MDKYPLLLEGSPAGELTAVREGLYTRFTARCPLPEGLWCAWIVGEGGELRLGRLLRNMQGAQVRQSGGVCCLALPWDPKKPFPLPALFCFAHVRPIGEGMYAVFHFDGDERPVF